ncbi:hypothetical protein EhV255 [Emiliania huxleyi virus 86]|uniref:Uncharacterized protein n=1 Tax=Emiliania huxleyi virus 86 (isolate United Kingdom/English Channel/1999) TaxID=654925 RepID=Q4A2M7_EHV8U|nr:hypothetical protein EhV255 [Emiliania huxleyi virus 86]CAI65679.1 hypothetical protein EhV255 [Emiliania huxleyi virus 86]CAZ69584.1 hypothetical protein [Emiliania huxleyi virus 99B1]
MVLEIIIGLCVGYALNDAFCAVPSATM